MAPRQLWSYLERLSSVAAIVLVAVVLWRQFGPANTTPSNELPLPNERIALAGAAFAGSETAKVALVEFSDFQCPFCSKFALELWPTLREAYVDTGRVRVVFRHLPLEQIHPLAMRAAEAAECGAAQNRFWQVHDFLFKGFQATSDSPTPKLTNKTIAARIGEAGVDVRKFEQCFAQNGNARIAQDVQLAEKLGISSTPVFAIGTIFPDQTVKVLRFIRGARPISDFRSAMDLVLASSGG